MKGVPPSATFLGAVIKHLAAALAQTTHLQQTVEFRMPEHVLKQGLAQIYQTQWESTETETARLVHSLAHRLSLVLGVAQTSANRFASELNRLATFKEWPVHHTL